MMTIDTHNHFWRYTDAEFGWIGDDMAAIRRDFLPADLRPVLAEAGVDGVVTVQARQSEQETDWLLELADRHEFIRGVVGWLPLAADDVGERIAARAEGRKLVGLRHVVQAEPDGFLDGAAFNRGVALLGQHSLTYDLLVVERQLPQAINFVDRHPDQWFVLDHLAKPDVDRGEIEPWHRNMVELARRPNVTCKISGGVTEVALDWTPQQLRPYLNAALETFGADRLMFGSNWPVSEAAGGYPKWIDAVRDWASALSSDEQAALFAGTAIATYRLARPHEK